MAGNKQSWVIGGSILLAAASGVIAIADEVTYPASESAAFDRPIPAISPESDGGSLTLPQAGTPLYQPAPAYCPPYETPLPNRVGRYRHRCRDKYWGYPEEFCEPPLGTTPSRFYMTQIANGVAARMVLYQYDFLPASDQLNVHGKAQVAKIARWLTTYDFPVLVEPTLANVELDELRRQSVWRQFSLNQVAVPSERIVMGVPNVRGIDAIDALSIDRNRMGLTFSRGGTSGGGGTSGSAPTSGGMTGTTGAR